MVSYQEAFDALLDWPIPIATQRAKYETIAAGELRIRLSRCLEAEDLQMKRFNRVTSKLPEIQTTYTGEPARYLYGVAKQSTSEYSGEGQCRVCRSENRFCEQAELEYACLMLCR